MTDRPLSFPREKRTASGVFRRDIADSDDFVASSDAGVRRASRFVLLSETGCASTTSTEHDQASRVRRSIGDRDGSSECGAYRAYHGDSLVSDDPCEGPSQSRGTVTYSHQTLDLLPDVRTTHPQRLFGVRSINPLHGHRPNHEYTVLHLRRRRFLPHQCGHRETNVTYQTSSRIRGVRRPYREDG